MLVQINCIAICVRHSGICLDDTNIVHSYSILTPHNWMLRIICCYSAAVLWLVDPKPQGNIFITGNRAGPIVFMWHVPNDFMCVRMSSSLTQRPPCSGVTHARVGLNSAPCEASPSRISLIQSNIWSLTTVGGEQNRKCERREWKSGRAFLKRLGDMLILPPLPGAERGDNLGDNGTNQASPYGHECV